MSMLHIVNKSPSHTRALESVLRLALPGSTVLLIEDGVYAASTGNTLAAALHAATGRLKVCALRPDCEARGLTAALADGIELVDYGGFVDLVAGHSTCQSWL